MKHPTVYSLSIIAIASLLWTNQTSARPIGFSEISLLVRAHESEGSIKDAVTHRRLLHALTPPQENILKSQGASDSLIQSLRNSNLVASKEEVAAVEAASEQRTKAAQARPSETSVSSETAQGKLYVFDVALGHPINFSQWGGYDCEVAFYSYRCAGEDIVEPAFIDNVRTVTKVTRSITWDTEDGAFARNGGFTHDWYRSQRFMPYDNDEHRFTPYDARRDLKDDRFNFDDTVSVSSRSASRPFAIDWSSPVVIKGVPYALYPVYGAGGVALYYIGSSSDSVKLAVSTMH